MQSRLTIFFVTIFAWLLFGCDTSSNTPSPNKNYFVKFYGDDGYQTGVDIVMNSDGTYTLFGSTKKSADDTQPKLFLVSVNAFGEVIRQKTFGDVLGSDPCDIELKGDGSGDLIVLANYYARSASSRDIKIYRIAQQGKEFVPLDSGVATLADTIGQPQVYDIKATAITEVSIGVPGYIISGVAPNNLIVNAQGKISPHVSEALQLRTNLSYQYYDQNLKSGATELRTWSNISSIGTENASVKIVQRDTNFAMFGYSNGLVPYISGTSLNYWIARVSAGGAIGAYLMSGSSTSDDRLGGVSSAFGNNIFYAAGVSTTLSSSSTNLYTVGTALSGNSVGFLFEKSIPYSLKTAERYPKVSVTLSRSGGFFLLTNEMTGGVDNNNIFLTKLDNNGGLLWREPLVYGGVGNDLAGNLIELADGKILFTGTLSQNGETKMVLIKVNQDGRFSD